MVTCEMQKKDKELKLTVSDKKYSQVCIILFQLIKKDYLQGKIT